MEPYMKIINLEQGDKTWLDWRRQGLGSTDVSALVGLNKYKTPFQVFEDKKGLSFPILENKFMTAGKEAEPLIRDAFNNKLGTNHEPICVESLDLPFLRGSLDGWSKDTNSILEIKYSTFPKMSQCIIKNDIDAFKDMYPQYNVQCQYFMFLTKSNKCDLATYGNNSNQLIYMDIPRDDDLIDLIVKEATNFWNNNILKNLPPNKVKGDFIYLDSPQALAIATELADIKRERARIAEQDKPLKKREDELKKDLIELGDDLDFYVGDIKMTRIVRAKLNTNKVAEDLGLSEDELKQKYNIDGIGFYKATLED
jgi:putative phage-type endonuclease